jgi:hypothetical protein
MQLHEGGVLYDDVFFVFPPGHLLSAWLGYGWSPPGLIPTRLLYAAFNVSLCAALYFLGRRLMPPAVALLGCAMLAVAAHDSHNSHYLFGYRYLLWSTLALLCFAKRLESGDLRWMLAAGAFCGLALVFRLTPAFAAIAGIGLGVLVMHRTWGERFADATRFGLGLAGVAFPVFAVFAADAGWEAVWREAVIRPVAMTDRQSLPVPPLEWPERWGRWEIRETFVAAQFRLFALLYVGMILALGRGLVRTLRDGRVFDAPLLLAVTAWGGLYFLRSFGRADEAHLDSALPVACLLLARTLGIPLRGAWRRGGGARRAAQLGLIAVAAGWVFLTALDVYLRNPSARGTLPVMTLDGATAVSPGTRYRVFDALVGELRRRTGPEDVVLDLTASSLLHVVAERRGPGGADVILPGTFLDPAEEADFVARLEQRPPVLVVAPIWTFDDRPSRTVPAHSPALWAWLKTRYVAYGRAGEFLLMRPRPTSDPR